LKSTLLKVHLPRQDIHTAFRFVLATLRPSSQRSTGPGLALADSGIGSGSWIFSVGDARQDHKSEAGTAFQGQ
jgi:hypothetical protein